MIPLRQARPFVDLFVPGEVVTINAERKRNRHDRAAHAAVTRQGALVVTTDLIRRQRFETLPVPVAVVFIPHQSRRGRAADTANHLPTCKAVLDGIVDAGLLVDDSPEYVVEQAFLPPERVPDNRTGIRVLIFPVTTPAQ